MNAAHAPAPHAGQPGHAARAPDDIDPPPDPAPHPPRGFRLPAGAVDTHAHVIGREYIAGRSYTPRPAHASDYLRMLDATGMQYGVLVQVSVHGSDNTLLLQALREQPGRLRGIAVAPHDLAHAEWETLAAAGVVGLRLNTTTGGGVGVAALAEYEAVCLEFGWHLQFLVESRRLPELAPGISRLRVPAVFDHMGYVHAGQGRGVEGHTLRALVRDGAWVKLSGAFRNSEAGPPYDDTLEFTAALAEAGPQRCVWGSDWPHVSFRGRMPNPGDLLDVLGRAVPDAQRRDAILATNAQRLYGFTPPAA